MRPDLLCLLNRIDVDRPWLHLNAIHNLLAAHVQDSHKRVGSRTIPIDIALIRIYVGNACIVSLHRQDLNQADFFGVKTKPPHLTCTRAKSRPEHTRRRSKSQVRLRNLSKLVRSGLG